MRLLPTVSSRRGFTLIELVVVLSVIAVILAFSVGGFLSFRTSATEDRARTELQLIQQGLEAFRTRFGDYPHVPETFGGDGGYTATDTANQFLVNALYGRLGPKGDAIAAKPFLHTAALTYDSGSLPYAGVVKTSVIDPWGNPYVYNYQPDLASYDRLGYLLYSLGPDGLDNAGGGDDILLP